MTPGCGEYCSAQEAVRGEQARGGERGGERGRERKEGVTQPSTGQETVNSRLQVIEVSSTEVELLCQIRSEVTNKLLFKDSNWRGWSFKDREGYTCISTEITTAQHACMYYTYTKCMQDMYLVHVYGTCIYIIYTPINMYMYM